MKEQAKKNLLKNLEKARKKLGEMPGGTNLSLIDSTEKARAMQLNSAKARKENNQAKKDAQRLLQEFKERGEEMEALNLSGLQVLKLIMGDAIVKGDTRTAATLASQIAEYETPKLTRQEVHATTRDVSDLSDDELNELLVLEGNSEGETVN